LTFTLLVVVTWRMLKESAVFFVLLGLFGIGFGQALMGLDVADEKRDSTESESCLPLLSIPSHSFFLTLLESRSPLTSHILLFLRAVLTCS